MSKTGKKLGLAGILLLASSLLFPIRGLGGYVSSVVPQNIPPRNLTIAQSHEVEKRLPANFKVYVQTKTPNSQVIVELRQNQLCVASSDGAEGYISLNVQREPGEDIPNQKRRFVRTDLGQQCIPIELYEKIEGWKIKEYVVVNDYDTSNVKSSGKRAQEVEITVDAEPFREIEVSRGGIKSGTNTPTKY